MKLSNLKTENAKAILLLFGGAALIIIVLYYIRKTFGGIGNLFGNITDSLGITTSKEVQDRKNSVSNAEQESSNNSSAWSVQYQQQAPVGSLLLTSKVGADFSKKIWDSVGIFTSDIEIVYGVFRNLKTKSQVSSLADWFNRIYGKDLLTWLTKQYSEFGTPDKILVQIINYVNSLPKYNV